MSSHTITRRSGFAARIRRRAIVGGTALAFALVPTGVAQADWFMSKSDAKRATRHYVSDIYANTYASDITAACSPRYGRYNPRYDYHAWVCGWYDSSDDTSGAVRIVGRRGPGYYQGSVITHAH